MLLFRRVVSPELSETCRRLATINMERPQNDTDPEPLRPEIHCTNCGATRTQRAKHGPCCKEPFWTVPYELIWRSLPHGEDR